MPPGAEGPRTRRRRTTANEAVGVGVAGGGTGEAAPAVATTRFAGPDELMIQWHNVPRDSTATTRPFALVLCTVAWHSPAGGTNRAPAGRPGFPVRGGTTFWPNTASSASG